MTKIITLCVRACTLLLGSFSCTKEKRVTCCCSCSMVGLSDVCLLVTKKGEWIEMLFVLWCNLHTIYTHTHTHLFNSLCPGVPRWAGTRKVKSIWILQKQETVSGSGISWAICKSAPCSRQIPRQYHTSQFFYRLDALPATQPTVSKHQRHYIINLILFLRVCCRISK